MKLRGQKIVAFDRYGQKQGEQGESVMQWEQSQLPAESDILRSNVKCWMYETSYHRISNHSYKISSLAVRTD